MSSAAARFWPSTCNPWEVSGDHADVIIGQVSGALVACR
jgi:hypothetical protein